jgi:hypothetical protein
MCTNTPKFATFAQTPPISAFPPNSPHLHTHADALVEENARGPNWKRRAPTGRGEWHLWSGLNLRIFYVRAHGAFKGNRLGNATRVFFLQEQRKFSFSLPVWGIFRSNPPPSTHFTNSWIAHRIRITHRIVDQQGSKLQTAREISYSKRL